MAYTYDPHRHVKIWLSKDRDSFLNLENQLRMINMRQLNPTDAISFVFDSRLLSNAALNNLQAFCKRYHLSPVDLSKDVFPKCQQDAEKKLIALYQTEIDNLGQGGNLGAASDILRWLSPIYQLGTYTDCDVVVNTRDLPPTVEVKKPLLLSLGSHTLPVDFNSPLEQAFVNNNMIAVVDSNAALEEISRIQTMIIESCSRQNEDITQTAMAAWMLQKYNEYDEKNLAPLLSYDSNYPYCQELLRLIPGKTMHEIRLEIAEQSNRDMASEETAAVFTVFNEILKTRLTSNGSNPLVDKEFSTAVSLHRFQLLKISVTHTSGPGKMAESLWGKGLYTRDEVDELIAPYAFSSYPELDICFHTPFSLHMPLEKIVNDFRMTRLGDISDVSWLEEGKALIIEREKALRAQVRQDIAQRLCLIIQPIKDQPVDLHAMLAALDTKKAEDSTAAEQAAALTLLIEEAQWAGLLNEQGLFEMSAGTPSALPTAPNAPYTTKPLVPHASFPASYTRLWARADSLSSDQKDDTEITFGI